MKKRVAFVPVIHEGKYVIGAAEENVEGWTPTTYDEFGSYAAANEFAKTLNREKLDLTDREAAEIVCSSMFPRKLRT